MTRVQILEDQKAIFTAQKEALENKRGDIYVREQKAISDALLPFFQDFPKEVLVEVTRSSVYFKMDHPEVGYKKELFTLYLRENYNEEGKSFSGVDLSYYSTSTKGVDKWELKRLQLLGFAAGIVFEDQEKIVDAVNATVVSFREEYDRVYDQMSLVGKAIRELDVKISAVKREKITFDLLNEGIEFNRGVNIQMKFNYTPLITSIKLIDMSKTGKKATAVFTFAHGDNSSREENINVGSIIDQVLGFTKNIVQHTLAE